MAVRHRMSFVVRREEIVILSGKRITLVRPVADGDAAIIRNMLEMADIPYTDVGREGLDHDCIAMLIVDDVPMEKLEHIVKVFSERTHTVLLMRV